MTIAGLCLLLGTISGVLATWYGLHRSRKSDAIIAETGAATDQRAGTAQAFEILHAAADLLREDNKGLREDGRVSRLEFREALRHCRAKVDQCDEELDRYRRRFGDLPEPN